MYIQNIEQMKNPKRGKPEPTKGANLGLKSKLQQRRQKMIEQKNQKKSHKVKDLTVNIPERNQILEAQIMMEKFEKRGRKGKSKNSKEKVLSKRKKTLSQEIYQSQD